MYTCSRHRYLPCKIENRYDDDDDDDDNDDDDDDDDDDDWIGPRTRRFWSIWSVFVAFSLILDSDIV